MNWRLGMALGATLLIAGCGHDDGESNEQAELSGVLQAGNVSGVHYRTPTREGVTDASGTFKYLAGETVAFSIGGIQLGSAPGSTAITPFTLAGMTPPTTEPALRRELDRASRTRSPFVRAINMQRLLLALDADNNPANGLDLRGREATLESATLDFDQTIPQFMEKLDKLAPDLTHNMPRWLPVVHLYRSLGISVPVHVPVQYAYDDGFGYTWQTVISYYSDGSLESHGSHNDLGGNTYISSYLYDALGRTTVRRDVSQWFTATTSASEERTSHDARGTLISNIRERDEGGDGTIDHRGSTTYETDAFANVLRQVSRQDSFNDGTIDWVDEYRTTYDARLNLVASVSETDGNADGILESRTTYSVSYDSLNRPISALSEWDSLADGTVNSRDTTTLIYNASGRGAVEIYERDEDADGDQDLRLTYRWTYDVSGAVDTLDILQEYNINGSQAANQHLSTAITFDRDAHTLTETQSEDWDGYPGYEIISRRVNTYDGFGNLLRVVTDSDAGGDGVVDERYTTENEYGAGSELLRSQSTYEPVGSGPPRITSSMQATNIPLADGVLALSQQYFTFAFLTWPVAMF